jgi:hypothetical protein
MHNVKTEVPSGETITIQSRVPDAVWLSRTGRRIA